MTSCMSILSISLSDSQAALPDPNPSASPNAPAKNQLQLEFGKIGLSVQILMSEFSHLYFGSTLSDQRDHLRAA
jgi:hypothetical protein